MKLLHIGMDADKSPDTSLMKVFKRHVKEYRDINSGHPSLNNEIVRLAREFKPDLVWMQVQTEGVVTHYALSELKKHGAFVINWTGDVRQPLPRWYLETGKEIGLTLFTNWVDIITARDQGINADFCPIGYDPDIYRPDYNVPKSIEVAFFANNYNGQFPLSDYRAQIATFMKSTFGERFKLFGNGWKRPDGNYNHSQPEEAKILRQCKIAINVSHFDYEGYSSDRLNRILGCGVMCLTHPFQGMELLGLEDGVNCVTFGDLSELQSKVTYYLSHETERKKIAAAGHKLAVDRLTFTVMIEKILSFYPMTNDKALEFAAREIKKENEHPCVRN